MLISAKVLVFDIETMSGSGSIWGVRDQNIAPNQTISYPYLLCWAAKWIGKKQILSDALIKYPESFKPIRAIKKANLPLDMCSAVTLNDKGVCKSLWKLMDEADIVLAHNGDRFDVKKMNSFFIKNDMPPPSPYLTIDTLKTSRSSFGFMTNRLDAIARELGIGHKLAHLGFDMWKGCAREDHKSWKMMIRYNKIDVELLEEYYHIHKPFIKNHPNMALYEPSPDGKCPKCCSPKMRKDGKRYTKSGVYQLWECKNCGHYAKSSKRIKNTSLS